MKQRKGKQSCHSVESKEKKNISETAFLKLEFDFSAGILKLLKYSNVELNFI